MINKTNNPGKLIGRALLIGKRAAAEDAELLAQQGLQVELSHDPYAAVAELSSRPLVYRAVVVPMPQIFPEELSFIRVVKRRFPHVQVIASEVPERKLEEMRKLGVDAILLDTEIRVLTPAAPPKVEPQIAPVQKSVSVNDSQPVLTAEELRALLSDGPFPSSGTERR
ncbi:MAG TPA: hypothetical protein VGG19_14475 [Tepidisphaeraceae bacterium]